MRRVFDPLARFLVGFLFIFSGLIKLNDPVGTAIKMEEYFEVFMEDFGSFFHYFIPIALPIAMVLIVLEIALGVGVLIYYRMKVTGWVLLVLMLFFTFLTFYSAYFEKVTDCGCFGDAIKLTPWESFLKDVVLLVLVLHLFWYRKEFPQAVYTREGHFIIGATSVVSLILGAYAIRHLPFIDFRAYKVGNNIPALMRPEEQAVFEYTFMHNGTEVRSQKYLTPEEGYEYKSFRVLNEDKTKARITDFAVIGVEKEDLTSSVFQGTRLLIIIVFTEQADTDDMAELRSLIKGLDGKVDCLVLTSSPADDMEAFRHEHQLAVPYAFADATVLKTIIRSNPGISLWNNGTVLGNWHHNDTPTAGEILNLLPK